MILSIALFVLLAGLSAYREVQILIERGSWNKEDYRDMFWHTDWKTWKKDLDSFHVSGGAFALVMFGLMSLIQISWWMIPIAWYLFFKIRNIFMHIVFKRKPLWSYLYKL